MTIRFLVVPALLLALAGSALAAEPKKEEAESYFGFDIARLAEASARETTFRTQYGDRHGPQKFAEYLESIGLSEESYRKAYNAWWERFRADETGRLEARFHIAVSENFVKLNYGDAPDHRQEKREGVTLEQYAKVSVALSLGAQDKHNEILRQHGFRDPKQWERINEAWIQAMREDQTIMQQYGTLYFEFAGPDFAKKREEKLGKMLAERFEEPEESTPPPPPEAPPTAEDYAAQLSSPNPKERWYAARQLSHECYRWKMGYGKGPTDPRNKLCTPEALRATVVPLAFEALEKHDDKTIGDAAMPLDYIKEFELGSTELRIAIKKALDRDRKRLAELEAEFGEIQDKAVPRRLELRPLIEEYKSVIRELERELQSW